MRLFIMFFANADQTLLNLAESEYLRTNQNTDFKDNTRFANQQAQQMQRESDLTRPANQVAGFQNAGFSPLASLGNISQGPVTSSNVAMPSPSVGPAGSNSLLEGAQAKLLMNQADKLQIENNRMRNEDSGAYQAIKSYAEAKLRDNPNMPEWDRKYWNLVLERDPSSFNLGDIKAEINFKDLVSKDVDTTANAIKKHYENYMWEEYRKGKMPFLEVSKNEKEVQKLIGELANLQANTLLTTVTTLMKPTEVKKLESEIQKNIAEANSIYHGDLASLLENKDYLAILSYGTQLVGQALLQYGAMRGAGKAFAGAKLSNGNPANGNLTKQLKENLSKGEKRASKQNYKKISEKNARMRKFLEDRENERRRILRNTAMPNSYWMM